MTTEPSPARASASRSETEAIVARVWSDLFQKDAVGPHDNFFDLGGDSMALVVMQFRLAEELGTELPLAVLIEHPVLGDLCGVLEQLRVQAGPAVPL